MTLLIAALAISTMSGCALLSKQARDNAKTLTPDEMLTIAADQITIAARDVKDAEAAGFLKEPRLGEFKSKIVDASKRYNAIRRVYLNSKQFDKPGLESVVAVLTSIISEVATIAREGQ